jgi:hypothetical protein
MSRLSIAIAYTPTPTRTAWLKETLRRLVAEGYPRELLSVVQDAGRRGPWPTVQAAWEAAPPAATHHLVLADDMQPVEGFRAQVATILELLPEQIITLFTMRRKPTEATRAAGRAWFTSPDGTWGGAVILPRGMIADFLEWERFAIPRSYRSADRRMALWAMERGHKVWHSVPSLLEHVGAGESLLGHANRARVAAYLATPATPVDWTAGLTDPRHWGGTLPSSERAIVRAAAK